MSMNVPRMKLKDYFAILNNLLVLIPAMTALATKQLLIPAAAALHILHGDQRLSFHMVNLVWAWKRIDPSGIAKSTLVFLDLQL